MMGHGGYDMAHREQWEPRRGTPPQAARPALAAVVAAVLHGAINPRQVQEACGFDSMSTAFRWMRKARDLGLVAWEDHHANTLRPAIEVVAHTPKETNG